jgi:hypothetical protein
MAMRHVHYDDWAGARVPGYLPLGAYHRLLASILGAVVIATVFWAGTFLHETRVMILRGIPPADVQGLVGTIWGVKLTGNLVRDSVAFAVTRLESPFVVWTVVLAGVVILVIEYRRSRFDCKLERRG